MMRYKKPEGYYGKSWEETSKEEVLEMFFETHKALHEAEREIELFVTKNTY